MKIILFIYGSIIGSFLPLLVERIIAKRISFGRVLNVQYVVESWIGSN